MFLAHTAVREQEDPSGGDGYVYGTDCGDGLKGVYLFPGSSRVDLYVNSV